MVVAEGKRISEAMEKRKKSEHLAEKNGEEKRKRIVKLNNNLAVGLCRLWKVTLQNMLEDAVCAETEKLRQIKDEVQGLFLQELETTVSQTPFDLTLFHLSVASRASFAVELSATANSTPDTLDDIPPTDNFSPNPGTCAPYPVDISPFQTRSSTTTPSAMSFRLFLQPFSTE